MKLVPLFPDRSAVAVRRRRRQRLLVWGISLGVLAGAVDGGLFAVRHWWPQARIATGSEALARVTIAGLGEHIASVRVLDASGRPVDVKLESGRIEPGSRLPGASKVSVTVDVRRSGWLGWLVGHTEEIHAVVRTPASYLESDLVYAVKGQAVRVRFSSPIRVLSVRTPDGATRRLTLPAPRRIASIGVIDSGANIAGTAFVAAAPRRWESVPAPVRISWFPAGNKPKVLVRPAPKSRITPSSPIVLTFSRPVTDVLGRERPRLVPAVRGAWHEPNAHTLVFQPSGLGFPLGRRVRLRLPRAVEVISGTDPAPFTTLSWRVPGGSPLRLKELLAELGYLPLSWSPARSDVAATPSAQARAAVEPPSGTFTWRFAGTPEALKELWASADTRPVVLRGAIMAFEASHGMPTDGYPSHALWKALLHDELAGRAAPHGYSYVFVTETLPQTLTLWHNGRRVLQAAVNTGIASRPTALGTYPVYAHLVETTMQGTNPDGTHYSDPGVPWVNYFNGGDAVHGFIRPGYGWPQSLGCVEAPYATAEQIFPYVQIGTLVTVAA